MKSFFIINLILLFSYCVLGEKVSGYVYYLVDNEKHPLETATIKIIGTSLETETKPNGFFSFDFFDTKNKSILLHITHDQIIPFIKETKGGEKIEIIVQTLEDYYNSNDRIDYSLGRPSITFAGKVFEIGQDTIPLEGSKIQLLGTPFYSISDKLGEFTITMNFDEFNYFKSNPVYFASEKNNFTKEYRSFEYDFFKQPKKYNLVFYHYELLPQNYIEKAVKNYEDRLQESIEKSDSSMQFLKNFSAELTNLNSYDSTITAIINANERFSEEVDNLKQELKNKSISDSLQFNRTYSQQEEFENKISKDFNQLNKNINDKINTKVDSTIFSQKVKELDENTKQSYRNEIKDSLNNLINRFNLDYRDLYNQKKWSFLIGTYPLRPNAAEFGIGINTIPIKFGIGYWLGKNKRHLVNLDINYSESFQPVITYNYSFPTQISNLYWQVGSGILIQNEPLLALKIPLTYDFYSSKNGRNIISANLEYLKLMKIIGDGHFQKSYDYFGISIVYSFKSKN